jgi:hypothetical protein
MDIPGKKLEKAAGEVLTDAGKKINKGMEKLAGAAFGEWVGSKEAKAEAGKMAIETQAQIEKETALQKHRHQSELRELKHRALFQRRVQRLQVELVREQVNLEHIATLAIEYTGKEKDPTKGRDLDEDWMFRFAEFAQRVSDKDVQNLWARVLSNAATSGKQRLSAAALQIMALMDREAAVGFERFCRVLTAFGYYPGSKRAEHPDREIQGIDVRELRELGLINDNFTVDPYNFQGFSVFPVTIAKFKGNLLHSFLMLTKRGDEIANAIFDENTMQLQDDLRLAYIQAVIETMIEAHHRATLLPSQTDETLISPIQIKLTHPQGDEPIQTGLEFLGEISDDLRATLDWASNRYDIGVENNI